MAAGNAKAGGGSSVSNTPRAPVGKGGGGAVAVAAAPPILRPSSARQARPGGREGAETEGGRERGPVAAAGPSADAFRISPPAGRSGQEARVDRVVVPSPRKGATSPRPRSSPSNLPSMGGGIRVSVDKYGHGLYSPTNELIAHTYLDSNASVRRGVGGVGGSAGGEDGVGISGAEVLRRQRMPLSWLQGITRELLKESGGVPPARTKIWGRAAAELLQMAELEAGRRDPSFVLKQWTQRKAEAAQQLSSLEAEHAEHTCRSANLKSRADLMEQEVVRLRAEKERSVVVAMTSLAAVHQLKTADKARAQRAHSLVLVKWARCVRLAQKHRARSQLLRHFGRKRKKQRTLLRVHGGGAEGTVRQLLEYADVLRQQVSSLAALKTGLQQLRSHYASADATLQHLKGEKEEDAEVLATLKALEGEMDRVVAEVERSSLIAKAQGVADTLRQQQEECGELEVLLPTDTSS